MAYEGIGQYVAAVTIAAIERIDEHTSAATIDNLAGRVVALARAGTVSEEQFELIRDAMLEKVEADIPEDVEPTTEEGLTMQDLADGLADLSEVVDGIVNS